MKNQTKKFFKRPEYPGGKAAFKEYVKKNLVYPAGALENRVEGVVHLSARIDDNGMVTEVSVERGIGFGCDEEAARLINNIHYGEVRNKRVRVKTRQRFRIEFRLPEQKKNVSYHLKKSLKAKPSEQKSENKRYSYTININNKYLK